MPVGADPRRYARVLAKVHEATLSGARAPTAPRPVIGESWRRMRRLGLDPERGAGSEPLPAGDVEARRRESGLAEALPILRRGLTSVAEEAAHIMVVVDADGRVLWRDGSAAVRLRADRLGFTEGASWQENSVGTNAIGTALVARRPMQVYSAEHYVRTHHEWTCAAAPLHDPRDGRLLGVVDLSGPAATVHPSTLALVAAVAGLAEAQLRNAHLADLERLRARALPTLSSVSGKAMVVDQHGWVAAVSGLAGLDRVALPSDCRAGRVWLPAIGTCLLEPVPGGWLLRLTAAADRNGADSLATSVVVDVRDPRACTLTVTGPAGHWSQPLSPRHAELLYLLAKHREGRSAAQLATDLFGDSGRTGTVRAEVSRLRRQLGAILARTPYRFADGTDVSLCEPDAPDLLFPHSTAPAIRGG